MKDGILGQDIKTALVRHFLIFLSLNSMLIFIKEIKHLHLLGNNIVLSRISKPELGKQVPQQCTFTRVFFTHYL